MARARFTDPETSHEAAASVEDIRKSQAWVYMALNELGSATDEQLNAFARRMGYPISPSGLRTRRSELVGLGLVVDSGQRQRLASGRRAILWQVKA
jgi:hypothetical protein